MRTLLPRTCQNCSGDYTPTSPAQKVCTDCKPLVRKLANRERQYQHAVKTGRIKQPGVGRGNGQGRGTENHNFKTGIGIYTRLALEAHGFNCNRCGVNTRTLGPYQYAVHHKDRDRSNNDVENLEVLCKSCHQLEHDCTSNLPNQAR